MHIHIQVIRPEFNVYPSTNYLCLPVLTCVMAVSEHTERVQQSMCNVSERSNFQSFHPLKTRFPELQTLMRPPACSYRPTVNEVRLAELVLNEGGGWSGLAAFQKGSALERPVPLCFCIVPQPNVIGTKKSKITHVEFFQCEFGHILKSFSRANELRV